MATAKPPTQFRPLIMPGSTALDPGRIVRAASASLPPRPCRSAKRETIPLRPALPGSASCARRPGQGPATSWPSSISADVGNKKNDLFEAIIQYRMDKIVLDRAEDKAEARCRKCSCGTPAATCRPTAAASSAPRTH